MFPFLFVPSVPHPPVLDRRQTILAESVVDYFPMVPGSMRTYLDVDTGRSTTVDEFGAPVEINGKLATPVLTRIAGKLITTTYYRVDGDTVYLVGYGLKHPLPTPEPMIQFDGKQGKWGFSGLTTDDQKTSESLRLTGTSKIERDRDVFGKRVKVLVATIDATVGDGPGAEHIQQVATYAKGIGLIELQTITHFGRNKAKSVRTLVSLEGAKSSG